MRAVFISLQIEVTIVALEAAELDDIQTTFQSMTLKSDEGCKTSIHHFPDIDAKAAKAFDQAKQSLDALELTTGTCADIEGSMSRVNSEIAILRLLRMQAEMEEARDERMRSFKRESISRVDGYIGTLERRMGEIENAFQRRVALQNALSGVLVFYAITERECSFYTEIEYHGLIIPFSDSL